MEFPSYLHQATLARQNLEIPKRSLRTKELKLYQRRRLISAKSLVVDMSTPAQIRTPRWRGRLLTVREGEVVH
jgi:hypothetical protein